ncbi:MAG: hypothetical protein F4213_03435 [Boseongicola sp. SB0677_bin_26]|nr:hypothetical protein [Boseongicola sp. SB0665_bin_10]MYG25067.1 hypothetical protein [Boseongicola sp. SB0677_bin_26]
MTDDCKPPKTLAELIHDCGPGPDYSEGIGGLLKKREEEAAVVRLDVKLQEMTQEEIRRAVEKQAIGDPRPVSNHALHKIVERLTGGGQPSKRRLAVWMHLITERLVMDGASEGFAFGELTKRFGFRLDSEDKPQAVRQLVKGVTEDEKEKVSEDLKAIAVEVAIDIARERELAKMDETPDEDWEDCYTTRPSQSRPRGV